MKNDKLQKSIDRLQVDITDCTNSIIYEMTEEIEELENKIESLEKQIEELTMDKI